MESRNSPVTTGKREFNSGDVKPNQRASVDLDLPRESESIVALDGAGAGAEYCEELAFMEEPVTVRFQKGSEKFAPNVIDCWTNGRGAEQFVNGKWMVCGWLPVNHPVITKRKYLEVLARAKHDSIQTEVTKYEDREDNKAVIFSSGKYPFSVIQDNSPRGHEWLTRILMEQ